ncbi:MAG: UbiX family flavin prenyltransferase [Candidatus Baldrarchaeia archaeon]
MRVVVAMTGCSGIIYGVRLLETLKQVDGIITYLIISDTAKKILKLETQYSLEDLRKISYAIFSEDDMMAPLASSSFNIDAMVIVPCSLKTLSALAYGLSQNLIVRCADNVLRTRKKLVLVPRETPLSDIHLINMLKLFRRGAIILPAMPAFYHNPRTIADLIDFVVGKILDALNIRLNVYTKWGII